MQRRNLQLAAEGTYERNTIAVKSAVLSIKKGDPDAVIMIGAYKPCAEFIRLARQVKLNPIFVNISFVGSQALAKELGAAGAGVVVTQVVPFPGDPSLAVVGKLSGGPEGSKSRCRTGLRLARRLHGRPSYHHGA